MTTVGQELAHESAHLHVTGKAAYTDDLSEPVGLLHAALGLSPVAHGRLLQVDVAALRALPGVVAVFTADDIPGLNRCGPVLPDEPILAEGEVRYAGQPVFAVVATERRWAIEAAARAAQVLTIEPLPACLSARQAHALGQYVVPPMELRQGDGPAAIAQAPLRLKGTQVVGGQEQFYLEGQISCALPQEDGGMRVWCSTQHPSEMQHLVAHALGVASHAVAVECRRMGGGFGGKESQSALFACVAAVAAQRLQRPVKLRLDRDDDFRITGRRHPFEVDWEVGYDTEGRILGAVADFIADCGHSADLSGPVMTRALCHFDNAYFLPAVLLRGWCARTHKQSNTAFRGFGGPQGALIIECILDAIARERGLDPLDVRRINLYSPLPNAPQARTPYGQVVEHNIGPALIEQLSREARYAERRASVQAFNAQSPVVKRGLALTPVKFGISFNLTHLNQAGALVQVYTDGSVLVHHGGTEMGQGLHTKVLQVVAQVLGLPMAQVRIAATQTAAIANTSATAASTGADLNGMAAQDAAQRIRGRLQAFWAERHGCAPSDVVFQSGAVHGATAQPVPFAEVVAQAYTARVQLWSEGFYATPGLHWDRQTLTGRPFHYYAWGAALTEVALDALTGETRVLAVDILHDVGASLNPAIDTGQVEGGYVQGMGWMLSESLWWHPQTGVLMSHAPSTYKIPCANNVPEHFRVQLYGQANGAETIHRSKAVGEPPVLLAFSAFLAVKDAALAILADGGHTLPAGANFSVPAVPETVLSHLAQWRNHPA